VDGKAINGEFLSGVFRGTFGEVLSARVPADLAQAAHR
jgi:hypothetical protein